MYVTLDGVMEDPGGAEKSKHGGWSFQFWSEEAAKFKFDELFASGALLLGRVTYQGFAKLKQQPGQDILIAGSGELVRALMQHDLIDEYRLLVHPVVLGSGKRLFRDGSDTKVLRLVETKTFSSGVVLLRYQPDKKEL
jgi:dihydrofolate reductase